MENTNKKAHVLNVIFSVLLFGGLWGIIEATLGTFLHLPFIHRTMFLSSTTILIPIAYFLMGLCYKKTGTFRSVLYMGILAAAIKIISCAIFKMSFNPAYHMLMEALAMGIAVLVIRPKEIVSFKGLGTFILANFIYLSAATVIRVNVVTTPYNQIVSNIEKYVFTYNAVSILYTFGLGAILYGFKKLVEAKNWNFEKVKKVIYHPAFVSSIAAASLVITIVLH